MADEAFALSPISARAALPSEADYDAIREAFMETSRGRWFLGEYAKRNRNADTSMVLDAVARIEETLAQRKPLRRRRLPHTKCPPPRMRLPPMPMTKRFWIWSRWRWPRLTAPTTSNWRSPNSSKRRMRRHGRAKPKRYRQGSSR